MMLYKKSNEKFSPQLFAKPAHEYRAAPFWAWNTKIEKDTIRKQIDMLYDMGMGGFHIHVRTGLQTEYLSREFLDDVRYALEYAKKKGMKTYLYDEDRWPSGACGGRVVKDTPEYKCKYLVITPYPEFRNDSKGGTIGSVTFGQDPERKLLKCYDIILDNNGYLESSKIVGKDQSVTGIKWYVYLNETTADGWFNNETYIDTLNPKAAESFIEKTHEVYKREFENEFSVNIPSIFTDEPQFVHKNTLSFAAEEKDVILPWTSDFPESFQRKYDINVWDILPEVIWNRRGKKISEYRYYYHDHICERFVTGYMDVISTWCEKNHLLCTGHVLHEQTLESQTQALGEAMRCYRNMQLPGIDILCNNYEYNTVKQAQSIVHQKGIEGMTSELYGVTGWNFDFRGFKLQGDWQAALGVTLRVPHLTWMTMEGEAKRDYPPCIGYQSPWWEKYHLLEDYFARINVALTRGKPVVKVGVIHPIESYWVNWGPTDQSVQEREELEQNFADLTEWLLFGLIDFDFISESCLDGQREKSQPRSVGRMRYEAIIVPPCTILRNTTVKWLENFAGSGGQVIFLGKAPDLINGKNLSQISDIYDRGAQISCRQSDVLNILETYRMIDIRRTDGSRENRLICQIRKDGDAFWIFIATGRKPESPDIDTQEKLKITVKGRYQITELNPYNGQINVIDNLSYKNGKTSFNRIWYMHDSLLLRLEPITGNILGKNEVSTYPKELKKWKLVRKFYNTVGIVLNEPNVLLLDRAEYSLNGGKYESEQEILRIDNACREKLGIPLRKKHIVQPYLVKNKEYTDYVDLRFNIESELDLYNVELALERSNEKTVIVNDTLLDKDITGWYVDECIQKIRIPELKKGKNQIVIREKIGERTNMEWCYLLGMFGVKVLGTERILTEKVSKLGFGNIVTQGLPYYSGNVSYLLDVMLEEGKRYFVRVPSYRGALISVKVDGQYAGDIICSPYILKLPELPAGMHSIQFELYGNRSNGFGQIHHEQTMPYYQSPDSWRSTGDFWCDEYRLKDIGILKSPELYEEV